MAYELFGFFFGLGWVLIGIGIFVYCWNCCRASFGPAQKSADYKKYLTNMYISSKIRYLAKKDELNLTEEEKSFAEYNALSEKNLINTLDEKIESDLMDRVKATNDATTDATILDNP